MMLRQRSGTIHFKVINKATTEELYWSTSDLSRKQLGFIATRPDGAWQYAQHIRRSFAQKDLDVAVYATNSVSVNRQPYALLINPETDLAAADWNYWGHADWLLINNGPNYYSR